MTPRRPSPRRRWRAACAAVVTASVLATGCSGEATSEASGDGAGVADAAGLFDPTVVHEISVDFDQADYDAMIDEFVQTGEKGWIEATVTVDGTTYERAGLRLKGNSSLMGLRRSTGDDQQQNEDGAVPDPMGGAGADTPEQLPWLIRLDEFVDGQRHQGYADIVIRSSTSTTSLNEALALDLLAATTLASQEAVSTSFAVNGGDPLLRLAIEHPDDDAWQDQAFAGDGALYKAESTGDWSYRGDDPEAYTDVFDQEGGSGTTDLTPLIDLLQFVNESDDATFAAELDDHLDVQAFADYLALMDLLDNFDDIDGPGNNAYLWWDAETDRFTIVPWDMNLAFGAFGGAGPTGFDPSQLPEGVELPPLPEGVDPSQLPEGIELPEGFDPTQLPGGGALGGSNPLVTRFHADADFEALYQERLAHLRSDLFGSGAASDLLDARVATLADATELVDAATLEDEADALRAQLEATAAG